MIGVGPAAAATATERALDALGVDHVLVCGIAGGLGKDLEIGSVVMPARVVDLATEDGFDAAPFGPTEPARTIGTTHELILDAGRLDTLRAKGIDALDMETAAVARVCANRGVPWSAVRSMSDRPQDGLLDDSVMEMLNPDGTANAKKAIRILLTHPWKIAKMARLGRDSSLAATRAAKAALQACTG
jgi:nucleoside phosphorylase